nr:filamentous hemagglutinin N-terminal domain-containing protein [Xenococcaceae cyanobacterium MO_234.B1]
MSKIFLSFLVFLALIPSNAVAQITPDSSLGDENSMVETNGNRDTIKGGAVRNTNIFHSFQEFNVGSGREAYFANPDGIANIFTRVTGNNFSNIQGVLGVLGNANLYLINPNGILFGENAKLNINGSFFATTAEQVIFADGTTFNTQVSNVKPLLTVSLPVGLQYGTNPGAIVSSNNSDEPPPIYKTSTSGNTFALLGGEVTLNNTVINSFFGRVEIAAVGKEETIQLQNTNGSWEFDYSDVTNFANISIGQKSEIDSLGNSAIMNLRGDNIIINSSDIFNSNTTKQNDGTISLTATNSIQVNQGTLVTQLGLREEDGSLIPSTGKGGDISLNAREIILTNGSVVSAGTLSEGAGGNINIQAQEYLEISDVRNSISPSGDINIVPSFVGVTVGSSGSGGKINIETDRLNLTDGGIIDSSTFGIGDAGTIEINARDSITISGKGGNFNSGVYASSGLENV